MTKPATNILSYDDVPSPSFWDDDNAPQQDSPIPTATVTQPSPEVITISSDSDSDLPDFHIIPPCVAVVYRFPPPTHRHSTFRRQPPIYHSNHTRLHRHAPRHIHSPTESTRNPYLFRKPTRHAALLRRCIIRWRYLQQRILPTTKQTTRPDSTSFRPGLPPTDKET